MLLLIAIFSTLTYAQTPLPFDELSEQFGAKQDADYFCMTEYSMHFYYIKEIKQGMLVMKVPQNLQEVEIYSPLNHFRSQQVLALTAVAQTWYRWDRGLSPSREDYADFSLDLDSKELRIIQVASGKKTNIQCFTN